MYSREKVGLRMEPSHPEPLEGVYYRKKTK